jgi:hypothetical protein
MKIILWPDNEDWEIFLTTDSPQSRHGLAVLRQISKKNPHPGPDWTFGPKDRWLRVKGEEQTAADIVMTWAREKERTQLELEAARDFLRQWPEGPQLTNFEQGATK